MASSTSQLAVKRVDDKHITLAKTVDEGKDHVERRLQDFAKLW